MKLKKNAPVPTLAEERKHILNEKTPFAAQEAYKNLRTNLMFSTAGDGCKVILVTSPEQGEAKSTTAVNLALSFSQNNAKVLLVDGDLRLPTVARKLALDGAPGLTDLLVGRAKTNEAMRVLSNGLYLLPSGTVPPNPVELLGARQMENMIEFLRKSFDYIIIDTPPVNVVSDALVLSPRADGTVLVVRQGVSTMKSTEEAIRKLEFAEAKILGFVFTDVHSEKKHGKYGGKYGYSYSRRKSEGETRNNP